jgi:hypothetical protein
MLDTSAFALTLAFSGTLGVGFLIFVGQVISFMILLGIAAVAQLLGWAARVLSSAVRMAFLNESAPMERRRPDSRN